MAVSFHTWALSSTVGIMLKHETDCRFSVLGLSVYFYMPILDIEHLTYKYSIFYIYIYMCVVDMSGSDLETFTSKVILIWRCLWDGFGRELFVSNENVCKFVTMDWSNIAVEDELSFTRHCNIANISILNRLVTNGEKWLFYKKKLRCTRWLDVGGHFKSSAKMVLHPKYKFLMRMRWCINLEMLPV